MEKTKLIQVRNQKGITQKFMAEKLFMDVSNYNRREKGLMKISPQEWERIAAVLNVKLDEIYETDDHNFFVFKDQSTGNYLGNNNIYSIPEYILDVQKKYIQKLEEENKILREKLKE